MVGQVFGFRRCRLPCAPASGSRARAELDGATPAPVQSDHVEPCRRCGRERAVAVQRHLAHGERDLAERGSGRNEKRDDGEQGDLHRASRVPAAAVGLKAADRILTS
jgi:hypothetical protein